MNITNVHLEAAIIDQIVAGMYPGVSYAFVAVVGGEGWQLGVAVANEDGYNPIAKTFDSQATAEEWANDLNKHIGLSDEEAMRIVISTMGGVPHTNRW